MEDLPRRHDLNEIAGAFRRSNDMKKELPPLPSLPVRITDALRKSHGFSSRAHWIVPGVLMQGERPGFGLDPDVNDDLSSLALAEQVGRLVDEGNIRTFVSLQAECSPEEGSSMLGGGGHREQTQKDLPPYAALASSAARDIDGDEGSDVKFLYCGIRETQPDECMELDEAMELYDAAIDLAARMMKAGETGAVYVHCGEGLGRAGMLCACLLGILYRHTWMKYSEAMDLTMGLCNLRREEGMMGEEVLRYQSPETEEQRGVVVEFFWMMRFGDGD